MKVKKGGAITKGQVVHFAIDGRRRAAAVAGWRESYDWSFPDSGNAPPEGEMYNLTPLDCLVDIIARLPDHPMKRINELLPHARQAARATAPAVITPPVVLA